MRSSDTPRSTDVFTKFWVMAAGAIIAATARHKKGSSFAGSTRKEWREKHSKRPQRKWIRGSPCREMRCSDYEGNERFSFTGRFE
jgi:hypothetical protein